MCARLCSNLGGGYMVLDKNRAKEIGEALIDAAEQVHKHSHDQATEGQFRQETIDREVVYKYYLNTAPDSCKC